MSEANTVPSAVLTVSATDADDAATNDNGVVTFSSAIGKFEACMSIYIYMYITHSNE